MTTLNQEQAQQVCNKWISYFNINPVEIEIHLDFKDKAMGVYYWTKFSKLHLEQKYANEKTIVYAIAKRLLCTDEPCKCGCIICYNDDGLYKIVNALLLLNKQEVILSR